MLSTTQTATRTTKGTNMTAPDRPTTATVGTNDAAAAMSWDASEFLSKMGLDQYADGTTGFIGAREHAWHGLGTVMPSEFTIAEAMTLAKLGDWNVRKLPIFATEITDEGVTNIEVADRFAIVRTNPETGQTEPLTAGQGNQYTPIQNEAHAEFLTTLTDSSGAVLETAGSLQGGKRVFFSMKMPNTMLIGGVDAVDTYLIAQNYHDGTGAFTAIASPIRPVCQNTLNTAINGAQNKFKIRHTSGASAAIAAARETLGLTFKYAEAFEAEAEKMIQETITAKATLAALDKVWTKPKGDVESISVKRWADRRNKIMIISELSPTLQTVKGTRWGAYQAVTEYLDHYAPTQGKRAPELVRAERVVNGTTDDLKTAAFAALAVR
jgi:phage/plasmid-like protein (TIGR03299 family)